MSGTENGHRGQKQSASRNCDPAEAIYRVKTSETFKHCVLLSREKYEELYASRYVPSTYCVTMVTILLIISCVNSAS